MKDYVSFGTGDRTLIVLPGLSIGNVTASGALLGTVFRKFTKDWTVYVMDRPEVVPEGADDAFLAEACVSRMKELGIAGADIIGVSQGGMIAQHIAVRHPLMVHKLVLGATLSRSNPMSEGVVGKWISLAQEGRWYDLNKDTFQKLYTDGYLQKNRLAMELISKSLKPSDPERFVRLAKACLSAGPFGDLGRIRCPVLVLGSEDDPVVTGEASREIAAAIEGCELFMYSGMRHAIYDESKDFYKRALDFLL